MKKVAIQIGRYALAKQFKRMRQSLKKMRTWLGRVIRDVRRMVAEPDETLATLLALCERLQAQQPTDKKKLYSLHEPDVQCISQGKAHKRYEFGQKISVATSNRENWIVGVMLAWDARRTESVRHTNPSRGCPKRTAHRAASAYRAPGQVPAPTPRVASTACTSKIANTSRINVMMVLNQSCVVAKLARIFSQGTDGDRVAH